ncbi:MAG: hypothetical protein FGM15_11040 [Chthoniobacterales bacterium]|nr:hypothetical protein [Chthoniobacterales bacterium]
MRAHPPVSPRARRALRRLGLQHTAVSGSGPGGRILEADVLAAARGTPGPNRRRAIAARTLGNFTQVPHFYLQAEADASALMETRKKLLAGDGDVRVTFTDFLLAAQGRALADCPWANAIWRNDGVQPLASADVGLVVALEDGLLIPILRGLDRLSVKQIAAERARLVENARAGRLAAPEMDGGATSLSNLGKGRVDSFAAIIHQPQSTMLAAGQIAQRPWVADGKLVVAPTIRLTLSVDHRVLDGDPAARFLDRIVYHIERPPVS